MDLVYISIFYTTVIYSPLFPIYLFIKMENFFRFYLLKEKVHLVHTDSH